MYTPPTIQHPRHLEHRHSDGREQQEQLSEPLLAVDNAHDPYQHHHQHQTSPAATSPTSEDDTLIWDQLNDAQSREVQQHQSRFHATPSNSRSRPGVVIASLAQTTGQRFVAATMSAAEAAREAYTSAWDRYPTYTTNSRAGGGGISAEDSLDREFGLQRPDPQVPMSETLLSGENDIESGSGSIASRSRQQQRQRQRSRPNNNNSNNPFVILSPFRMVPSEREGWGAVSNLDLFLSNLYSYYYHRGWVPIVCRGIVEVFILVFTFWLSVFLLRYVDWHSLSQCHEEATCRINFSDYIIESPFSKNSPSLWNFFMRCYVLLFGSYTIFHIWSIYQNIQHAMHSKYVFEEKLGISRLKLQGGAISWDHVVERLLHAQESNEYRITISGEPLDALVIAQRIMRKENFLISFFNASNKLMLDPLTVRGRQYFCKTLEWSIYFCILNFMFNHKFDIRPSFYLDPASLKRRFVTCGVLHTIFMPFLLLFITLHFVLTNAYEFKTKRDYMGVKNWNLIARWIFREFNELPHVFDKRLDPSYDAAETYLKLFGQNELLAALGRVLQFVGGALGGVLLVLAAVNDAILLHVQIAGRNLLWYAGMAGIVYSIGKAISPAKEAQPSVSKTLFQDMDTALRSVANHTHYYPDTWKGRGWDNKVHKSFSKLIDTQVKLFIYELLAVIMAPYILCHNLPQSAEAICEFCLMVKSRVAGAGEVCGYSTFDFDVYGDEAWEGRTLGKSVMMMRRMMNARNDGEDRSGGDHDSAYHRGESLAESILRVGNVEDATRMHPKPKAREGKMEKSFFNFQASHPSWKCSPSGQSLVDRVEEYRQAELAALSRERELHIEAAARQLETLAKLERKQRQNTSKSLKSSKTYSLSRRSGGGGSGSRLGTIDETYIPRIPHADAGAGSQSPSATTMTPSAIGGGQNPVHEAIAGQSLSGVPLASGAPIVEPSSRAMGSHPHQPAQATATPTDGQQPGSTVPSVPALNENVKSSTQPVLAAPAEALQPDSRSEFSLNTPSTLTLDQQSQQHQALEGPTSQSGSTRDALRASLSTELRHILNMSTLADPTFGSVLQDPASSTADSNQAIPPEIDRTAERQVSVSEVKIFRRS